MTRERPELHIPITDHPDLPDGVPLVAEYHDDRNRLSYYYPLLEHLEGVQTPATEFFRVEGSADTFLTVEYREITRFMQDLDATVAFTRSDYSSGKYEGETGSKIESQDPYDIETTVTEMIKQLCQGKRRIGGRIAVREWIPHDAEVRCFLRDGEVLYRDSLDEVSPTDYPDAVFARVANQFDRYSWSVDAIRHEETGDWFVIDMGLDGLYPYDGGWVAMSEHLDKSRSPQNYADEMPGMMQFRGIHLGYTY